MIRLHHLNRSRSFRVLWLLEELGVEYELIKYRRDKQTNLAPSELLAIHPLGKSPVLELDGRIIAESAAIVEILCATYKPEMIPALGSDAHISHLELIHFAEGSVMTPILLQLYVGTLGRAGAPLSPRIEQQLTSHYAFMEQSLRPSGHFVQDDLSAADIMLSFPIDVAMRQSRQAEFPNLAAFATAIATRPAYLRAREIASTS